MISREPLEFYILAMVSVTFSFFLSKENGRWGKTQAFLGTVLCEKVIALE